MSVGFANHGHLARALSYHGAINVALSQEKCTSHLGQVLKENIAFWQKAMDNGHPLLPEA